MDQAKQYELFNPEGLRLARGSYVLCLRTIQHKQRGSIYNALRRGWKILPAAPIPYEVRPI